MFGFSVSLGEPNSRDTTSKVKLKHIAGPPWLLLFQASMDFMEDLICSICLEVFKQPVILKCGHNYCKSCIDNVWKSEGTPKCPECRVVCLEKTYTFNRILCRMSQKACSWDLEQAEDINNLSLRVTQLDLHAARDLHLCEVHKEGLKLFCEVCESPVCVICRDSKKHAGHNFLPIQEAEQQLLQKYKNEILDISLILESQLEGLRTQKRTQEQKKIDTKNDTCVLEQHISSEFAKMYQFLHEKEESLIQLLRTEETLIIKEVEDSLEKLQKKIDVIQKTFNDIQSLLCDQDPDNNALLKVARNLIKESHKEMLENADSKGKALSTNQRLGVFRGPLQYSVWKEMKSIINPAPSSLFLDPETANDQLTIFEDHTAVSYSSTHKQYSDSTKRFLRQLAVLGCEGVRTGKHYWEVVVNNKNEWSIGVVRESIERKFNPQKKPEEGFWNLYLREYDVYKAMDSFPHVLSLPRKPQKIGVYLDYEGGQISFYDAGDMSHLYTFNDTFTDTLYLYLNPCDNEFAPNLAPLKLFHLSL
ncbi:zinc-binding protein A33-like isoform X1 [Protopterus annectens]|uniref:zinc-binding protein A33-like isoform X1 n=1 Tax=Protopterus annectens TaxID=7888 RepID=UPI001CFAE11A|nr:zinc-binding protein A33-like isoform X1 [Protopterus annectens]